MESLSLAAGQLKMAIVQKGDCFSLSSYLAVYLFINLNPSNILFVKNPISDEVHICCIHVYMSLCSFDIIYYQWKYIGHS